MLARSCLALAGALTAALALAGCGGRAIDDQASVRMAEARADTRKAMLWSSCLDKARPLGPDCGLLARGLTTEEFLRKFERAYCTNRTPEQCHALYERAYAERLRQRYHAADFEAVERHCDAHPGACDDAADHERLLLRSHNAHTLERGAHAQLAIERERVAAHQRHDAASRDVVDVALFALHRGPRCVARPLSSSSTALITCEERRASR